MIIAKRLKGKAIAAWLGPTGDAARRAVSLVRNRLANAPRRLDFYFDPSDPWSHLTAQAVSRLVEAYGVELAVHVVTPPASDVDAAPALRLRHAVRDAQLLADYWNLEFAGKKEPDTGMLGDVCSALVRPRPAADRLRAALELTGAMWRGDRGKLASLLGAWGTESQVSIAPILNEAYTALRKAGHYQGATIHYDGTWYTGIDRVPYLEAALARDLGVAVARVVSERPLAERAAQKLSNKPLTCELWFSFRSPYSYLALEQIEAVLAPYQIPLVLRPVAGTASRGVPMPTAKRLYIVRDAKREADRLGIAFGELCEPPSTGLDHCVAIAHWANKRGAGLAFARSAMRGIWAEARDVSAYVDLRELVERAGLPWAEAQAALGDPEAAKAATAAAADMAVIGLWGVPSFRVGDLVTWGQDRLPILADQLRRHALATAAEQAS
ncbi:MAG: DsbA family protein [Kofleriaceae bacterium]